MPAHIKSALQLFPLLVLLALVACGGGGGGGGGGSSDAFSLSASGVTFAAIQGGTPGAQAVGVTVNSGLVFIGVTANGGLVTADFQTTGQSTGVVTITPNAATMAPGTYSGSVMVRGCTNLTCSPGSDVAGSPKFINVTYNVGADIAVSTTLNNITHVIGSANPAAQSIDVVTAVGVAWTASASQPWLSLSSNSGTGSGSVNVSVDPGGLAVGTYNGTITFTAPSSGETATVPVTLNVVVPAITTSSGSLSFTGIYGATVPSQTVSVAMNNGAAVSWTAAPGNTWLVLNPSSGTTPAALTVGIDPSGLGVGTHTSTITITGNGLSGPTTLNVTFNLFAPTLSVTPGSLSFGGRNGGLDASGKTVQISLNTGTNAYGWSASSPDAWLQVSPAAGSISATPATVTVTVDAASLANGTHNGSITFTALVNGVTVNRSLPIDLRLDAHKVLVSDVGVALTSTPSLSKLTRTLRVRSNRGATINWSANSDQAWLSATSSGVTAGDLVLTANPSGLAADTLHHANVVITSNDASVTNSETVRIGLWVGSTTPTATTLLQGAYAPRAVDPIRPYVYRHGASNSIIVSNIYTGGVVTTILTPAGTQLGEVVVANDGSRLFVADNASSTIIPIDLPSFSVGTGWANGTSSWAPLEYVRSNGVGLLISGNGRFLDPTAGTAYSTTFTPESTYGVDRVRASRDGNLFCHQNVNLVPYTVRCRGLYLASDTPGQVQLGPVKTGLGESGTQITGSDFAVNRNGTRVYVPSRNCCSFGQGEFRVFDATTLSATMPVVQTLNYSGNPNNAEVDFDGRIFLGSDLYGTATDVWVHDSNGSFLASYELSAPYSGLIESSLMISGDGLRAITNSDRGLITTIGP